MVADERSHDRRIVDLMARVQSLEARARQEHQLPASAPAPRERWLARTTSDSPGSYPTSGNTFACELLSCHFPATPGSTTITEIERGRTVVARTRPAAYLERGTEVEVWRSRGHGALGVGEWWIGTAPPAPNKNRLFTGGANYGRDYANVQRQEFGHASNLRLFPGAGETPTPDVPNQYLEGVNVPANQGQAAIIAKRAGIYLVTMTLHWTFPNISIADHLLLYDAIQGGVSAFAPPASAPNWMTGNPSAGVAHQHQYWPHVYHAAMFKAYLHLNSGLQDIRAYGLAPVARALDPYPAALQTMTTHGWLVLAAGDTITIEVSGAYTFPTPSGFGAYSAAMSTYFISLLWIS